MSLTRRQKWRIEKVQSERITRANKAAIETEKNIQIKNCLRKDVLSLDTVNAS